MRQRVPISVDAADPVSQAGVVAQLRARPELAVHEERGELTEVVVVVANELDDAALGRMRSARCAGCGIVLVAGSIDDAGLLEAVEAGAAAIVPRAEATPERLVTAIGAVAEGRGDVPASMLGRLLDQVGDLQRTVLAPRGLNPNGLSTREVAVLSLIADGYDTSEIATSLAYSERTVKNVVHDITSRFQLRNRSHAVAFAVRRGLI